MPISSSVSRQSATKAGQRTSSALRRRQQGGPVPHRCRASTRVRGPGGLEGDGVFRHAGHLSEWPPPSCSMGAIARLVRGAVHVQQFSFVAMAAGGIALRRCRSGRPWKLKDVVVVSFEVFATLPTSARMYQDRRSKAARLQRHRRAIFGATPARAPRRFRSSTSRSAERADEQQIVHTLLAQTRKARFWMVGFLVSHAEGHSIFTAALQFGANLPPSHHQRRAFRCPDFAISPPRIALDAREDGEVNHAERIGHGASSTRPSIEELAQVAAHVRHEGESGEPRLTTRTPFSCAA